MANKVFNTRLQQKRATQAQWEATSGFIPFAGEIIIYEPDDNYNYSRMKVGDGIKTIVDLPFVTTTINGKIGDINLTTENVEAVEPRAGDIPKVFIDGVIPTTKDDVLAEMTYISKSQ